MTDAPGIKNRNGIPPIVTMSLGDKSLSCLYSHLSPQKRSSDSVGVLLFPSYVVGRHLTIFSMLLSSPLFIPIPASISSSNFPERPTNGTPC